MMKKKSLSESIAISVIILLGTIAIFFLVYINGQAGYKQGYENASSLNESWIEIGVNQTLSNNTLMSNVANNFNVFYISQYNAIPVYYNDHLYQCTNFTEVKR